MQTELFVLEWYDNRLRACYVAIMLNGFDDQERNLTLVKKDFKALKLKFDACNFKQAFHPLHKIYIV